MPTARYSTESAPDATGPGRSAFHREVAQKAERRSPKPKVRGSIPRFPAKIAPKRGFPWQGKLVGSSTREGPTEGPVHRCSRYMGTPVTYATMQGLLMPTYSYPYH